MEVSGLIRAARKRANLSQVELAARLGVQRTAVAQWETGRNLPTLATASLLVDVLQMTAEQVAQLLESARPKSPTSEA